MNTHFILVLLFTNLILLCQAITEFRCTNKNSSDTQIVTLKCPPNQFINVKEALYGRNQWNDCQYLVGDCTEVFSVDTECCGRNDCNLVVRRIYSIKCMAYVSFFRVIYECETAERLTCRVHNNVLDPDFVTTRENSNVLPPTFPDVVVPTSDTEAVPKDVYIIVGSAATVAFLLAAIITVIFLLRKYKWHGEKQFILQLFVGLCKRHPPDGCENPPDATDTTGNEKDMHVQQIATISSLVIPQSVHSPQKILALNSTNNNKNTSLYGILKEISPTKTRNVKKEVIFDIPATKSVHNNTQVHDTIYEEIESIQQTSNDKKIEEMQRSEEEAEICENETEEGIFTDV